jgi:hypothetical protein
MLFWVKMGTESYSLETNHKGTVTFLTVKITNNTMKLFAYMHATRTYVFIRYVLIHIPGFMVE